MPSYLFPNLGSHSKPLPRGGPVSLTVFGIDRVDYGSEFVVGDSVFLPEAK